MATNVIEVLEHSEVPSLVDERPARLDAYAVLLVFVTILAAILRIHGIASKSFWMDEGMSVEYARLPWKIFLRTLWSREANMALYYVLLRYWMLLGRSDGFLRGVSALFSIATVPVFYALGRRLFNRQTAILAAFLLAIHAYHIRYAQEARSYAMVVFLSVVASWLLVRNVQEPSSSHWGAYTAVCVLAVYTHFYAGLVVVAHLAAMACLPRKSIPWTTVARHLLWFAGGVAPIAIFVIRTGTSPIGWVPPINGDILRRFGFDIAGNYGRPLLILSILAIGIALQEARRKWLARDNSRETWRYLFLFSWLCVPIAIVAAASQVRPLFLTRYMNPCLPALVLLVAAGVMALRPRVFGWIFLSAISLCSILGTVSYYQQDFDVSRQNWRAAADYVFLHAQPGDSIYFYQGGAQPPFDFYYRWQKNPAPIWPKSLNASYATEGNHVDYELIPGTESRASSPIGDRVWLVLLLPPGPNGLPDRTGAKIRDWFATGRHRVDVQRLYPIDILLLARTSNDDAGSTR